MKNITYEIILKATEKYLQGIHARGNIIRAVLPWKILYSSIPHVKPQICSTTFITGKNNILFVVRQEERNNSCSII